MTKLEVHAAYLEQPLSSAVYNDCLISLPKHKLDRIHKFRKKDDAQRTLLAELLIRSLAVQRWGLDPRKIDFYMDPFGKPHLWGKQAPCYNLSHSGQWIVCVLHTSAVGIDVQQILPVDLGIAAKYFSPEEYEDLKVKPEDEQLDYFYMLWTGKESLIKADGRGMAMGLNHFSIRQQGQFMKLRSKSAAYDWRLRHYDIDDQYKLCVCAKTDAFPEKPVVVSGEAVAAAYLSNL
ncbi:4'-phosphopantetheinyl transferase family protein [Paenibacillus eucommiae]|uniref:4'-phosphopantetheinyl transferase n=1 Tax=Paenibacillus eucommiae TaxID=1355755 RepID=A0ABS4IVP1_9BACL|nr:4'-phosphopantetheinyl transferase superfamily protein [Paenibacillus eucommiae]MBP1991655.1 4'-phosphopantetheinyl transferase [Paenibacillus eucommiae]